MTESRSVSVLEQTVTHSQTTSEKEDFLHEFLGDGKRDCVMLPGPSVGWRPCGKVLDMLKSVQRTLYRTLLHCARLIQMVVKISVKLYNVSGIGWSLG